MTAEARGEPGDPASLHGLIVLVTGASSPIGSATALALAERRASLVLADLEEAQVAGLAETITTRWPGAAVLATAVDVRSEESVQRLVGAAVERFGALDALVHCAGLVRHDGSMLKPLAAVPGAEMDDVIDTVLKGAFLCNRAVLPALMRRGSGQIINLSSSLARRGRALDAVVCAAHAGIVGLSEALGEEVGPFGIRVQVLLPEALEPASREAGEPRPAPGVSLAPERVAAAILYLLALPPDMILESVVVSAFRVRKRRTKATKD